jgi:hypothetical protein
MTLPQFAYLVAGPRDFVVNVAINMSIAWWLYRHEATTPWVGEPSVASMIVPMCFFLTVGTTFFGFLNGTVQRKKGLVTPALAPGVRWIRWAALTALAYGLFAAAVSAFVLWAVHVSWPDIVMPRRMAVVGIGLLAGVMAYLLHSHAVLKTARLG